MTERVKSVWKFTLEPGYETQAIEMPKGAEILTAREQGNSVCVWAMVDTRAMREARRFSVIGTGWQVPERNRKYIGTAQFIDGAPLVFHVFEVLS